MDKPSDHKDDKAKSDAHGDPPIHPLVGKVVKHPDDPQETVRVVGYLGHSGPGKKDFRRIYLDLDFRTYIEIKKDDVLHAQAADLSDEEKPTEIFIKATATLTLCQTIEAPYLKGAIASSYPLLRPASHYCPPPTTFWGWGTCTEEHPHTHFSPYCEKPPLYCCYAVQNPYMCLSMSDGHPHTSWGAVGENPYAQHYAFGAKHHHHGCTNGAHPHTHK